MNGSWSRLVSAHHLNQRGIVLYELLALATLLELAAGTGLAYWEAARMSSTRMAFSDERARREIEYSSRPARQA